MGKVGGCIAVARLCVRFGGSEGRFRDDVRDWHGLEHVVNAFKTLKRQHGVHRGPVPTFLALCPIIHVVARVDDLLSQPVLLLRGQRIPHKQGAPKRIQLEGLDECFAKCGGPKIASGGLEIAQNKVVRVSKSVQQAGVEK